MIHKKQEKQVKLGITGNLKFIGIILSGLITKSCNKKTFYTSSQKFYIKNKDMVFHWVRHLKNETYRC